MELFIVTQSLLLILSSFLNVSHWSPILHKAEVCSSWIQVIG